MKVLIVSTAYYPEVGAAPSRITNMAEGLHKKGVLVDVLTCMPNYPKGRIFENYRGKFAKKEVVNGVNVYQYWTYASNSARFFPRIFSMCTFGFIMWIFLFKLKKSLSYDRVIIQTPPILSAFSAIVLFRCILRRKTILNVSDIWPLSVVEGKIINEGCFYHKFLLHIENFIYKHSVAYQGQSQEILDHIEKFDMAKPGFLYRNLQHKVSIKLPENNRTPFKIVFAGLLGVAQNILNLIKYVDFKSLGAEFHIYGGGNQANEIQEYLKDKNINVFYHGMLDKKSMIQELVHYNASIVPLTVRRTGAVPSKIFDLLPVSVPVLFCGGGEGADIVKRYDVGYVSNPGDFKSLEVNIKKMINLSDEDYNRMKKNCLKAAETDFSFDSQLNRYYNFLDSLTR